MERRAQNINPTYTERNPEFKEKTQEIMKVYRGWDKLEKPNGIDIIDFDLVPPVEPEEFRSREEVLDRYHTQSMLKI